MSRVAQNRKTLSKAFIAKLQPDESREVVWHDDKVRALSVSVRPSGAKILQVRVSHLGRVHKESFGQWDEGVDLDAVRKLASKFCEQVRAGENPVEQKKLARQSITLSELWDEYDKAAAKFKRASSRKNHKSTFTVLRPIWGKRIIDITKRDLKEIHDSKSSTPVAANRAIRLCSSMLEFARNEGIYDKPNPTKGIQYYKERMREEFLTSEQIAQFLAEVDKLPDHHRSLFSLLLLTGARLSVWLNSTFENVDWENRVYSVQSWRAKNGRPNELPLSDEVMAILERRKQITGGRGLIFPGKNKQGTIGYPRKAFHKIMKQCGLDNSQFCIHSLRHSFASSLLRSGASLFETSKALQHQTIAVTMRYSHLEQSHLRDTIAKVNQAMLASKTA